MSPKPKAIPSTNFNASFFKPGSTVEVCFKDPGFNGSFYSATIVQSCSSNSFLVEFKTLMAESTQVPQPLREIVTFTEVRPPPPRQADWDFRVGDKVDAYHNDGWWLGVVTECLGNGRFSLFFESSKENIEFLKEELRLHLNWIDGKWISPVKDDMKEENEGKKLPIIVDCNLEIRKERFSKGTEVEVTSDEEGFQGAWFTANIVEAKGKDKFLVEYHSLRTDDDSEFLREEFDILHIRPRPPEITVDHFKLLEEVDAFYNDGWWVGVISKILSKSRYIVFFRSSEEEIEFQHSELRVHQDWMDGKWVMPSLALKL